MLTYMEVQTRCTAQMQSLAREVETLKRQLVQLRAKVIVRDSALAWEREQRHALAQAMALDLLQEAPQPTAEQTASGVDWPLVEDADSQALAEQQLLEDSLHAADLVICQTGCISDGAYWRVKDHCKRTGKTCLLVDQPTALRVVRIHPSGEDGKVVAAQACIEGAS
ncbi:MULTISPECIES: DUF2325 domain-containing protein [Comamonas]|uniref:DUF2325 domain-containing protein n=2 Tax=Comamonas TaxID=283 RepID=A0A096H2J3_COMTE|nr:MULTISPECIES: DUF2325 domain-containing protein [Comamonas]KGH31650.1 hypothetical protein P353_04120 [Comamonas testosteroni]MPT13125.1 DUF2325 domain-containing protein [Comamonas sp.]